MRTLTLALLLGALTLAPCFAPSFAPSFALAPSPAAAQDLIVPQHSGSNGLQSEEPGSSGRGLERPGVPVPPDAPLPRQTPRPTLLIHGHYCGPGNDGMEVTPIDALDAACRKHDACTPDGGLPSCGCNRALKRDAGRVAASPREPQDLRALAGVVAGASDLMLCTDDVAGLGH